MSNVRFLGRRAGVATIMTALGSLLVTACAGDVSPGEDVSKSENPVICTIKNPVPGCNPTGTSSSSGLPEPWVEYETVQSSDVAATFGFLTPHGATIASVTVNLQAYTPTGPTDGLAVGTDATAVESHTIPVNGLVAGTTYRYDVWVSGIDRYSGIVTTLPPVTVTSPPAGTHDPVIGPVVAQAVASTLTAPTTVGFVVGVRRGAVEDLYYFGSTNLVSGPTTYAGTSIAITGGTPTANTVYELASVTKTLNATLLARYVNDSSLSGAGIHLSDTAVSYLPAAYQTTGWQSQITLLELSNMSAGLDDLANFGTLDQLFSAFDNAVEKYTPGTGTIYSDISYSVLGRTLEAKLNGGVLPGATPWESLIVSKVAVPLGMPSTQPLVGEVANCNGATPCNYLLSPTLQAQLAQNYDCTTLPCTPSTLPPPTGNTVENAAGGLFSTPTDVMQWISVNMGHTSAGWMAGALPLERSLSPSSQSGMWGHTAVASNVTGTTVTAIEKLGLLPGQSSSYVAYIPELDVGAFLLTNSDPGPTAQIVLDILANLPASNLVNLP
jgi:CubicO group peptidase (beta-lactamase class C family)